MKQEVKINMVAAITGSIVTTACKPGSNEILNPNVMFFASRILMALPLVLLGYTRPEVMGQDSG